MNGVIGPAGLDGGMGLCRAGIVGQLGEMRAGALPYDDEFGYDIYGGVSTGRLGGDNGDFHAARSRPAVAVSARSETSHQRAAAFNTVEGARRAEPKSVSRREKARAAHTPG